MPGWARPQYLPMNVTAWGRLHLVGLQHQSEHERIGSGCNFNRGIVRHLYGTATPINFHGDLGVMMSQAMLDHRTHLTETLVEIGAGRSPGGAKLLHLSLYAKYGYEASSFQVGTW